MSEIIFLISSITYKGFWGCRSCRLYYTGHELCAEDHQTRVTGGDVAVRGIVTCHLYAKALGMWTNIHVARNGCITPAVCQGRREPRRAPGLSAKAGPMEIISLFPENCFLFPEKFQKFLNFWVILPVQISYDLSFSHFHRNKKFHVSFTPGLVSFAQSFPGPLNPTFFTFHIYFTPASFTSGLPRPLPHNKALGQAGSIPMTPLIGPAVWLTVSLLSG